MRLPPVGAGQTLVGVVVPVPEPVRGELHRARLRFGDPEAVNIVPHVTLVGPTPVPEAMLAEVDAHLEEVVARHRTFEVVLQGARTFRPVSPVVYVALEHGATQCARREAELRSGPLEVESQFPYHPHVTVAHDLDEDALDVAQDVMSGYSARFGVTHVERFVHDGVRWCPVRRFALSGVSAGGSAVPGSDGADAAVVPRT